MEYVGVEVGVLDGDRELVRDTESVKVEDIELEGVEVGVGDKVNLQSETFES